jgi:hypothetical protein
VVVSGWNIRDEMIPVLVTALAGKREIPLFRKGENGLMGGQLKDPVPDGAARARNPDMATSWNRK